MKNFLSGNNQDKMNAFDGNKVNFFEKNLHPLKTSGRSTHSIPKSRKRNNFLKICQKKSKTE